MTTPLLCLLLFALWTVSHVVFGIGAIRVYKVLTGQAKPNAFPADRDHGGTEFYRRLNRVHLNCVENLPVFGAVVLVGAVAGVASPALDALAVVYLVARVAQSITHLASTRSLAVNIRFTFFTTQLVALFSMAWITWSLASSS